jgi:hypothetical protein
MLETLLSHPSRNIRNETVCGVSTAPELRLIANEDSAVQEPEPTVVVARDQVARELGRSPALLA